MKSRVFDIVKRIGDVCGSAILLVIFSPIFALLVSVSLVFQGRPVFFVQKRPGLGGKIFSVYKLRTMVEDDGVNDEASDLSRTTAIGRFLRVSSIDELPQLVNIFMGHMSFVGPRPLLVEYLPIYTAIQSRRHTVKPGLTGLAQVMGRKEVSWDRKLELDLKYVDNRSLKLDLWILWRTIVVVLLKRDTVEHVSNLKKPKIQDLSLN